MEETKIYSKYEDEQQLFAIIQAFELTSEAIGSIIFIFDINKRTALVSKSDAKFLGVPEVTYNVPYKPSTAGAVLPEYVNEYIRIHETVMEGADFAKGIVGLKSAKGIDYIYELSIRALKDKEGKHTGKAVGIYRNVTEYARAVQREIDLNLNSLSGKISRGLLGGSSKDELDDMRKKMRNLEQERAILLTENNFNVDYTDIKYSCEKCSDTGFDENGQRCSCAKERIGEAEIWQKNQAR